MAGSKVTRKIMDDKSSEAILTLRIGFDRTENVAKWLANNPDAGQGDPLVTDLEYTVDEAYLIRLVFQNLEALRTANEANFELARKLTGLD